MHVVSDLLQHLLQREEVCFDKWLFLLVICNKNIHENIFIHLRYLWQRYLIHNLFTLYTLDD